MILDNSALIEEFCPDVDDGDTFIYTEMLDRGKRKGNNGHRLLKTFFHRSKEEFREQMPVIRVLCDLAKIRACTRLAPRSYAKVGAAYTRIVVDAALSSNWAGMKSLYNRALGIVSPITKMWLLDVDVISTSTIQLGKMVASDGNLLATIPSKKGLHYIVKPFDTRLITEAFNRLGINRIDAVEEVSLHKDNPTNLYIPEGAD